MKTVTTTATPAEERAPLRRISTGNREVDQVLGGGFPANSVNIVMGQPGTGKTIFVQELVFHNASDDRPVLYLTTLSEPMSKVVRYLQRFSFYDEEKLGGAVIYQDLGAELAERGLVALVEALQEAIRALAPKIIVVDSFKALHDLSRSSEQMRLVLHELTGMLAAYDTTTFLVGEYSEAQGRTLPEFAIADGIVQFFRQELTNRDERFMRVLKLRGSKYAEGVHALRISEGGLQVFPRLVTPALPRDYTILEERVASGVPGLDAMLGGGLWRGSSTLLIGPTGGGKTTMAAQFILDGVRRGEPSLYINFQENPTQLARLFRGLGLDMREAESRGLHVLYESPVELQIDSVINRVFRMLDENQLQRVVVDSLGDLAAAAGDPRRLHDYMYALMQHFVIHRTTCMITAETMSHESGSATDLHGLYSYMSDNVVRIRATIDGRIRRSICVTKARGSAHDLDVHALELTAAGARIL